MEKLVETKNTTKYSNEEKLALGEDKKASALINIAQENDSNSFELLQNLRINNLRFIILKCSRFCFYLTFTVCTNVLNTIVFMVRTGKKKAI